MLNVSSYGVSATSRVENDDVAFFNASVSCEGNGNFNITNNVHDQKKYLDNRAQVDNDYNAFTEKVMALAQEGE